MIIVFGGAFNPPTLAHKEIYFHIQKTVDFDKFIYLPVSNVYTKATLIDNQHRMEMLKLLIEDMPKAVLSDLEMRDDEYLGTYQSLLRIQKHYPDQEIAFVIGADNLKYIHKWIKAPELLKTFKFVVINRNSIDIAEFIKNDHFLSEYQDHFILIPDFKSNISSTVFRETFDPEYVTEEVYDYIMTNDLYRGN